MNLRNLSDHALLDRTTQLVGEERKLGLEILHHLREIERRKLFAEMGYPSLFEFCVKHLRYSEPSAQRRIASMRLLKEIPELENKIQEGTFSITTLAKAQIFFKKESKVQVLNTGQKRQIIETLYGKSTRDVERELLSLSSQPDLHLKEKVKTVTPTKVEMTFFADIELQDTLEKIRGLLAHRLKDGSMSEVIEYMADEFWANNNPAREPKRISRVK